MQQRQLRLGDILDDYCPRERRVTNHAVVAMLGEDVKQTRCTTCDAEHEYKHAKVPRQRRKPETPAALYSQVLADAPKRVIVDARPDNHAPRTPSEWRSESAPSGVLDRTTIASDGARAHAHDRGRTGSDDDQWTGFGDREQTRAGAETPAGTPAIQDAPAGAAAADPAGAAQDSAEPHPNEDGPVHRPLIRATLPRPEGQPPASRPVPEFTIRQSGARPGRFRHRQGRGGSPYHGGRSNGNMGGGPMRGDQPRSGGRSPMMARPSQRQGHGRKRSK